MTKILFVCHGRILTMAENADFMVSLNNRALLVVETINSVLLIFRRYVRILFLADSAY